MSTEAKRREPTGRYEWQLLRHGLDVWWVPPHGARHEHLTTGPREVEAVAFSDPVSATGSLKAANDHEVDFAAALLAGRSTRRDALPAGPVEHWLHAHGIPLAPGWRPSGPEPVIEHAGPDRYRVSLDGYPVLDAAGGFAAVTVLRPEFGQPPRTFDVQLKGSEQPIPRHRLEIHTLVRGGWAVQVDEPSSPCSGGTTGNSSNNESSSTTEASAPSPSSTTRRRQPPDANPPSSSAYEDSSPFPAAPPGLGL